MAIEELLIGAGIGIVSWILYLIGYFRGRIDEEAEWRRELGIEIALNSVGDGGDD